MWIIKAFNGTTDSFSLTLIESIELFCFRHKLHMLDIETIHQV